MSQPIRIGTRSSELALWQAQHVKQKLEALGHTAELVPLSSLGDQVLDKPLYEIGVTGVFTRTLDIALLNGDIDIAVHSMKDVPTKLPEGIVQAAVLERGNYWDILAYKHNEEFLGGPEAVIATGSLRRKAQWLNRYPSHTVVDLRGNVNSRMRKLKENDWNGAIFAAAGLDRIQIRPEHTIGLTWMLPAPAQGALMVTAREDDTEIREACAALNHPDTETCTTLEREFLRVLEGGCSAPIGALATIDEEKVVTLKGVLLSVDGSQKLEVEYTAPLGKHKSLAENCAQNILMRGGRRLMNDLIGTTIVPEIFSTKNLSPDQMQRFSRPGRVGSEDFLKIHLNRLPKTLWQQPIQNVIITSQNAVEALLMSAPADTFKFANIYCVGRKTKRLIQNRIGPVAHQENSAQKLAEYLIAHMEGQEATYFCGDQRLDELPGMLEEKGITLQEVEAYKTKLSPVEMDPEVKAVLFFSPTTVESYLLKNKADKIAYCIGETTAQAARAHFTDVRVADIPTVEDLIARVNADFSEA